MKENTISKFRVVQGVCIFLTWTVVSFLCHQTAKAFLYTSITSVRHHDYTVLFSLALTFSQTVMCFLLVDIQQRKDRVFYVMTMSHVAATFCTNCSMGFMTASSTFAIKLMEPITTALVQRLVLATSVTTSTLVSLPLIVLGAVVFVGNPFATFSVSLGALLAFSSNIILAVRNVAIKLGQTKSKESRLRPVINIVTVVTSSVVFAALIYAAETRKVIPKTSLFVISVMLMSSFFHVVYSYVSTNVVLRCMTVLSHAVCNILKRVSVVFLLYLFGQRHANVWNFGGLVVCSLGLVILLHEKITSNDTTKENGIIPAADVPKSSKYDRRMLLVMFVVLVTAVSALVGSCGIISKFTRNHETGDASLSETKKADISLAEVFQQRTFGAESFKLLSQTKLYPDLESSYLKQNKIELEKFLKLRLIHHGYNAHQLSQMLNTNTEIIREAQRIHFNVFEDLIGSFKYAIFFDIASFENKGDPAITVGEVYLLRRLQIEVVYYCNFNICMRDEIQEYAENVSKSYSTEELVILVHGGGNLLGYAMNDILRERFFPRFPGFKIVVFPQSVYVRQFGGSHFDRCQRLYCCNPNLTIVLRDKQSLDFALKYWNNGTTLVMAPDMAFQIGPVRRFISPVYDVMWLKRKDSESPHYSVREKTLPKNVTVKISDWWGWTTPKGSTSMENAFLIANNGLIFLQRGRVVITDRLHGHILCTLLSIPHVLIDNQYKKLSSFHNTWTKSLSNVLITDDSSKAFELALMLLKKYRRILPEIAPFVSVNEDPFNKLNKKFLP